MDMQLKNNEQIGLYPQVFNVAPKAKFSVNGTCGQHTREEYCKTIDAHPNREHKPHCSFCDAHHPDPDRRHPIENVIDNTKRWWQSSTLHEGPQNEYITITMDLGQVSFKFNFYATIIMPIVMYGISFCVSLLCAYYIQYEKKK